MKTMPGFKTLSLSAFTETFVLLLLIVTFLSFPLCAQTSATAAQTPVDATTFAQIADLFQYDRTLPLEAITLGDWPYRIPYVIEKISYRSTHNEIIPGYFAHPQTSPGKRTAALLLVHGSNGIWGKNEDWALDWMDVLARSGRAVLVIDNYGFGERLKPGEGEQGRPMGAFETRDMVIQTVVDQRRGLDYLESRPEVDPSKIGLLGGSRGGWIGAMVAGLDHRVKAVVLTVVAEPRGTTTDSFSRYQHTLNFVPHIGAPVLMVGASRDKPSRVTFDRQLYAFLPGPKQEIWFESEHYIPPKQNNQEILQWLDLNLK
jgi:dienelactone hydrolase